MGSFRGEVRGNSKVETYIKYLKVSESWDLARYPDPKYKKFCKKQMEWDRVKREWILQYHFTS